MVSDSTGASRARCNGCGYAAPAGNEGWDRVSHPPLGTVTRCPECGSTNVHTEG